MLHDFLNVHTLFIDGDPEGFGIFEAFLHSLRVELEDGIIKDLQRMHFDNPDEQLESFPEWSLLLCSFKTLHE